MLNRDSVYAQLGVPPLTPEDWERQREREQVPEPPP
jgi:hypothetical protein